MFKRRYAMTKQWMLLAMLLISGMAKAEHSVWHKKFKITLVNLTKGQPLTPAVVAVHAPSYKLFNLGEKSSAGLGKLATDGVTEDLVNELNMVAKVKRTAVGMGIILPGKSAEIIVEANDARYKFSLVSMLARTNDAIVAVRDINTNLKVGQKQSYLAKVYDAGVEMNTQSCDHIPAPPCMNPGKGDYDNANFIRPHEGLLNIGDLDANRDAFASVAAKVIVERIQ